MREQDSWEATIISVRTSTKDPGLIFHNSPGNDALWPVNEHNICVQSIFRKRICVLWKQRALLLRLWRGFGGLAWTSDGALQRRLPRSPTLKQSKGDAEVSCQIKQEVCVKSTPIDVPMCVSAKQSRVEEWGVLVFFFEQWVFSGKLGGGVPVCVVIENSRTKKVKRRCFYCQERRTC